MPRVTLITAFTQLIDKNKQTHKWLYSGLLHADYSLHCATSAPNALATHHRSAGLNTPPFTLRV